VLTTVYPDVYAETVPNLVLSCVYGSRHIPFVHTFLFSALESCPNVKVIIGYSDFPEFEKNLLEIAYPQVTFAKIDLNNGDTTTHAARASKKTHLWYQLFENYVSFGDNAVFLDIDTIIVKPPFEVFASKADLALTRKVGKWPLNTGVIFVKKTPSTLDFFCKWNQQTESIISSVNLNSGAEAQSGGADQDSILKILMIAETIGDFSVEGVYNKEFDIQIEFLPCSRYNQTESVPFNNEIMIIHFKAGWHRILLSKSRYTRNRPAKTSMELHEIWKSCYSKSKYYSFKALFKQYSLNNKLTKTIVKDEPANTQRNYSEFSNFLLLFKILRVRNVHEIYQPDQIGGLRRKAYLGKRKNSKMTQSGAQGGISTELAENHLQKARNADFRFYDKNKQLRAIVSDKISIDSNYGVVIYNLYSIHSFYLATRLVRVHNSPSIIFILGLRGCKISGEKPSFVRFLYQTYFDRIIFSDEYSSIQQEILPDKGLLFWNRTSSIYNESRSKNSILQESKGLTSCFILPTPRDLNVRHNMFLWSMKVVLKFIKKTSR
jgi:hypothetical protein